MAKLVFWIVAASVFLLDRISKLLVVQFIPLNKSIGSGFVSLTHTFNTGTAFGLLKNSSLLLAVLAVVVSVYIIAKHSSFESNMQPVLGLVLGGALGNLVDRFFYPGVIDFIDFHFWPVFNIADSAITMAIICIVLLNIKRVWDIKVLS